MKAPASFLLTLFLLVSAVWGAALPKKRGSFQIKGVTGSRGHQDPLAALRYAYRKFGIHAPDNVTAAAEGLGLSTNSAFKLGIVNKHAKGRKTGNGNTGNTAGTGATVNDTGADDGSEEGEVPAESIDDRFFLSPVRVGSQTLMLNLDTGSSDFWVFSTGLPAELRAGHEAYDPNRSQTFEPLEGSTFSITYGDGSAAEGVVGFETVDFGGSTVDRQAIGLATDVSGLLTQDVLSDGLVGLAFSSLNTIQPVPQKTFFENLLPDLDEPVMTVLLKSEAEGGVGSYEFGRIDPTKFTGNLIEVPVDNSRGHWEIDTPSFKVGSRDARAQQIQITPTAIVDTGTTLMLASPELVQSYYRAVDGAQVLSGDGSVAFPCDAELPPLFVQVGRGPNHYVEIPSEAMNFGPVGTDPTTGQTLCFGGLQSNQGFELQIYGGVFLRNLFAVFNHEKPSISLAPQA